MPKNMGLNKNQWVRSDGGDALEFMLDSDLCLLFETPPKSFEKLAKTTMALAAQDGCCITCNDEENPQGSPAADAVKLFGNNLDAWLSKFSSVWTKVTTNGARGLFTPATCSGVRDWLIP